MTEAAGSYGAYVWASFALAGVILAGLIWISLHDLRKRRRELEALMRARREQRP